MIKKIVILLLVTSVLSACTPAPTEPIAQSSGLINPVNELFHDFGDVNIQGGLITHAFEFSNQGEGDLRIINLTTSCMCTKVEVVLSDGSKSPIFGANDSTQWNEPVSPGDTFDVLVTYDPMAHGPLATGPINRSIIMMTSSEENGRIAVLDPSSGNTFTQMNIKGMVLSELDYSGVKAQ